MNHHLRDETELSRSSRSSAWVFYVAAWFGVVTGLLEGLGKLLLSGWNNLGWRLWVAPDILWVAPAFNLLLFLAVALALLATLRVFPGIAPFPLIVLPLGLLSFMDIVGFSLTLRTWAIVVVSLSLALQLWRWLDQRNEQFLALCRYTLPYLLASVAALGLGVTIWERTTQWRAIAQLPTPPAGAPNVLLIVLDTVRADHLSSYGYPRATTPNLDQFTREGALWSRAYATSSWTLPAHASLFTGRYAHEHEADLHPMEEKYTTLAEALAARGYLTAGFSANLYNVTQPTGLARGFQHWEEFSDTLGGRLARTFYVQRLHRRVQRLLNSNHVIGRKTAAEVNQTLLDWLNGRGNRPFFVFLNYFDCHDPYVPPEPYDRLFSGGRRVGGLLNSDLHRTNLKLTPEQIQSEVDAYDGLLRYVDEQFGLLWKELHRRGLAENTLIIVTSDHGESFGEHELFQHGNSLYHETLHVPLILGMPGRIPPGRRLDSLASLRDIPATVMALLGDQNSPMFSGQVLMEPGQASEKSSEAEIFAEIQHKEFELPSRPAQHGWLKSLLTKRWQFIERQDGSIELYDLEADPGQLVNLAHAPALEPLLLSLRAKLDARVPERSLARPASN